MSLERVHAHFQEEAPDYDRLIRLICPAYEEMLGTVAAAMPFDREAAIDLVDLGCGTGNLTLALLERFPRARAICVDLAGNMLAKAMEKVGPGVSFVWADFRDYEFAGGHDAIVSSLALHHLQSDEDKKGFYRRVHEALAPGGVFYLADVVLGADDYLTGMYLERWTAFMAGNLGPEEVERRWLPNYYAEDSPVPLMTQIRWLVEIGFGAVDVIWKRYNYAVFGGRKVGETPWNTGKKDTGARERSGGTAPA